MLNRFLAFTAMLLLASPSWAVEFSFHGLLKPEVIATNSGVASYGSGYSKVAPTNALRTDLIGGNPTTPQETEYLESPSTSFQAAHSRFSFNLKHGKVRGVFEFDLIDGENGFNNQTAIQSQDPRVRLATVYYDATDKVTVFGGQKWTTAAGIKSNGSYNWIGNAYRAGNSGFLAMEVGASYKNEGLSLTGAFTGKGRNRAGGINANELGGMPGLAFDANYKFGGHMIGAAGHWAEINYDLEPTFVSGENQDATLFKVYGTFTVGPVKISAEAYTGEALNNQNALGVAPAAALSGGVVREAFGESGFFTFASWDVKPGHNIKVGYSTAEVDSGDRGRLGIMELSQNTTAYINYGAKITDSLTLFGQLTHFDTEFGVDFESFSAVETRAGVVFKF